MVRSFAVFVFLILNHGLIAQNNATYRETTKTYLTYPFSDPDPVPSGKIYPYYRFDGFTTRGQEKEWKVVILENDYILIQIMPEIGGKVWYAQDKKNNRPFLYNNGVVKFRDIAMRGPWVSGGIEANYGTIGHTPNSATPVDYLVRSNADGSVSCFISALDLLTRTRWTIEINLQKDKAYFTTRSFWFNSTGVEQPYYSWMNAGIPAGDDLKFLYPGNYYIGHEGGAKTWPMDKNGNDLSVYAQNNFGASKSYHVTGAPENYFGAIWEKSDFGVIHYANREEKPGKKIFLWAQSPSGKVWEDLLTDTSGQYVEIQSGRLFNQNQFSSSFTPFKQIGFAPYIADTWTEYWYPFQGLGGFSHANLIGAFNIQEEADRMTIRISPVRPLHDSLLVYGTDGTQIASAFVTGQPLTVVTLTLQTAGKTASSIKLGESMLDLGANQEELSRPVEIPAQFEANSAYGLYLQGRDLARFRDYQPAEEKIRESLRLDSLFPPALVEYGKLKIFRLQYDSAFYFLRKALSIDTYLAEANYYYGLAASKLSKDADAVDGFEVATLTGEFRNAAYTALAHHYSKKQDYARARYYANAALRFETENLDALQVLGVTGRLTGDHGLWREANQTIDSLNPLTHFTGFENYLESPTAAQKEAFVRLMRGEMPVESFLELAIWYANVGREEESRQVLEMAPQNAETLLWLAWLYRSDDRALSDEYLRKALATSPAFVFPFREESAEVFEWAAHRQPSWHVNYLLALVQHYRGNAQVADSLLKSAGDVAHFSPLYMLRARLSASDSLGIALEDVNRAIEFSPQEWRYKLTKALILERLGRPKEAIAILEGYYKKNPENYVVGLLLVKSMMKNGDYPGANKILAGLTVLPFEGAMDARRYYRETKLMMADAAMKRGRNKQALSFLKEAEEWPERLGVGRPYPNMIDSDLENWMKAKVYEKVSDKAMAETFLKKVRNSEINDSNYLEFIKSISSREDTRLF